jgi:hypothetical protein
MKPFILVSYFYASPKSVLLRKLLDNRDKIELVIDCGAFSFLSSGKHVSIDDYCAFCKDLPPDVPYFMLDEPYNAKKTRENWDYMLKKGLKPLPVFVHGEGIPRLKELMKDHDWIAVGGGDLRLSKSETYEYIKWVLQQSGGAKQLHIFGKVLIELFKYYHVKSFDNASLYQANAYHKIWIEGRLVDIRKVPKARLLTLMDKYGFDPGYVKDLTKTGIWMSLLGVLTYKEYAEFLYKRYGVKYFTAVNKPVIVNMFLEHVCSEND